MLLNDIINRPVHYTTHVSGVECKDVILAWPFWAGNAFKYVFRWRTKNGLEDLRKAVVYLRFAAELADDAPPRLGYLTCAEAERSLELVDRIYKALIESDEPTAALEAKALSVIAGVVCVQPRGAILSPRIENAIRWVNELIDAAEKRRET